MILSLGTIISRATELAGGRLDWQASDVSFYANLAYGEVSSRVGYQSLEAIAVSSTTSGENRIAVPSDFLYPMNLTITMPSGSTATSAVSQLMTLRQRDPAWADAQDQVAGTPEAYVNTASWIELVPSPNSAYSLTLRYQARVGTLVNSSDTPVLDERWHQGILYKTAELLSAARGDIAGEAIARNRYVSYMNSTPSDQALRQRARQGMGLRYTRKLD